MEDATFQTLTNPTQCTARLRTYLDQMVVYNEKLSGLHEIVHLVLQVLQENDNNNKQRQKTITSTPGNIDEAQQ